MVFLKNKVGYQYEYTWLEGSLQYSLIIDDPNNPYTKNSLPNDAYVMIPNDLNV